MQQSKILIIEEDHDVADSIKSLCNELGHDAIVAYDGATGLKMAADEKPELILSDVAIPGLDGFEVARRIRSNHDLDKTAIVAVTGTMPFRPAANQLTFDGYVIKPFVFGDLEKMINKFTKKR